MYLTAIIDWYSRYIVGYELTLKKQIRKLKTKYVINKIQQTKIPYFEPSPLTRQS